MPSLFGGVPAFVGLILAVEAFERFGYFTVSASKGTFMIQYLGMSRLMAMQVESVFRTGTYLMSWVGSAVADCVLGRYLTIGSFSIIYVVGMALTAVSTFPGAISKSLFFLGIFGLVPLASGGIIPLVNVFGADQIQPRGKQTLEDVEAVKARYYAIFYGAVNIGAVVATGIMTTVATAPTTFGIAEDYGYFVAYIISAGCMFLAMILFFSGTCFYVNKSRPKQQSSLLGFIAGSLVTAAKNSTRGRVALLGWVLTLPFFAVSFIQAFLSSQWLAWTALGLSLLQMACLIWAHRDNSFLGQSGDESRPSDDTQMSVQDLRLMFQTIPVIIVVNLAYNFIYAVIFSLLNPQLCQMNIYIDSAHINQMNPSVVALADPLAIIVSVPLLEGCMLPLINRLRRRQTTVEEKCVVGVIMYGFSVVVFMAMELLRKGRPIIAPEGWEADAPLAIRFPDASDPGADFAAYMGQCKAGGMDYCSNCASKGHLDGLSVGMYMSDISAFWMFGPLFLMGMSEVLVNPMLQYYAYTFTPKPCRSLVQAFCMTMRMYPNAIASTVLTLVDGAMTDDINRASAFGTSIGIEIFYYICIAYLLVAVPLMLLVIRSVKMTRPEDSERLEPLLDA